MPQSTGAPRRLLLQSVRPLGEPVSELPRHIRSVLLLYNAADDHPREPVARYAPPHVMACRDGSKRARVLVEAGGIVQALLRSLSSRRAPTLTLGRNCCFVLQQRRQAEGGLHGAHNLDSMQLRGERPWFVCPGVINGYVCRRRVAKLYLSGEYLLCRHCHDLTYETRQVGRKHSALRKCQKIRRRLGGSANMTEPFPPRPKGMHLKTYARLRLEHDMADRQYTEIMLADLEKLKLQFSRLSDGKR